MSIESMPRQRHWNHVATPVPLTRHESYGTSLPGVLAKSARTPGYRLLAAIAAPGCQVSGLKPRQPGNPATQQPGNWATWQPGNLATWQLGNWATGQPGNWATRQPGNWATGQ